MRKPAAPTCCVPWLCHLTSLESVAYVSRQVDFQLLKTKPRIMLTYSSFHWWCWTSRGLSCVQGLDCYIYTGTRVTENTYFLKQAEKDRKWASAQGTAPFSKWPTGVTLVLSTQGGMQRSGIFHLCSSLHRKNHQNGKKGKDLPLPTYIW